VLLGALSLDVVAVFFGGAVALLPVFARDLLVIGPWGLGLLRSATGLGAVGAAAWMAWRPLGAKVGRTLFVSVTVFGLATVLLGVAPDLPTALVALVVIGASDMVSVVVRQNLIQLRTPEEVRGRVVAVNQVFVGASNELGELESGVAATALGPRAAVVVGGLIVVLVTTTWTRLFPSLRALDRLDDQPADVIEKDRPS
jgi:MFS family permease